MKKSWNRQIDVAQTTIWQIFYFFSEAQKIRQNGNDKYFEKKEEKKIVKLQQVNYTRYVL